MRDQWSDDETSSEADIQPFKTWAELAPEELKADAQALIKVVEDRNVASKVKARKVTKGKKEAAMAEAFALFHS